MGSTRCLVLFPKRFGDSQMPYPRRTPPAASPAERYGCTCEREPECAACDQGHHRSCSYGCKSGQVVPSRQTEG